MGTGERWQLWAPLEQTATSLPAPTVFERLQSQQPSLWLATAQTVPLRPTNHCQPVLVHAESLGLSRQLPPPCSTGKHQNNLQIDLRDSPASPSHVLLGASVRSSYCLLGEHRGLQAVTGGADPNMTSPWSPGYGRQGHSTTEQMAPRPGSMGTGWVPWGLYQLTQGWAGGGMSSGQGWVPSLAVLP